MIFECLEKLKIGRKSSHHRVITYDLIVKIIFTLREII